MNNFRTSLNFLLLMLVMLNASCASSAVQPPAALATATQAPAVTATTNWAAALRYPRLARGVNLTGWFWYAPQGDEAIRARFSDDEFRALRQMGLTYVRLPIDLGFLLDRKSTRLNSSH